MYNALYWQSKLTNMSFQELNQELLNAFSKQEKNNKAIINLSSNQIVLFFILKELWNVYFATMQYLEARKDYGRN